jgi:hypothetical protein
VMADMVGGGVQGRGLGWVGLVYHSALRLATELEVAATT